MIDGLLHLHVIMTTVINQALIMIIIDVYAIGQTVAELPQLVVKPLVSASLHRPSVACESAMSKHSHEVSGTRTYIRHSVSYDFPS